MGKYQIPTKGLDIARSSDDWEFKGKNHLLAIGVDNYDHWKPPLNCAVKDIEDFTQVLLERYNFEPEHVKILKNEEATEQNIIIQLKRLNKLVAKDDNLIVYFSGHGHYDKDQKSGFWIPVNARQGDDYEHEYLDTAIIANRLKAIDSHHTYVIIDACFSGTMVRKPKGAPKSEKFKSRRIFTSGRAEVVNDGPIGGNSPFAKGMLLTLKKNDKPYLRSSDFMNDVISYVENQANQIPDIGILFDAGDEGGEFIFRLKQDEESLWKYAVRENKLEIYQRYLKLYPKGKYNIEVKKEIKRLSIFAPNELKITEAKESISKEVNFIDFTKWNDKDAFHILRKEIEIDYSPCKGVLADPINNQIVQVSELEIKKVKDTQKYFLRNYSSTSNYPSVETDPRPDKVLNLDVMDKLLEHRKKYQTVAFYDVSKIDLGEVFSIFGKNYLPESTCKDDNSSVSIGSELSCDKLLFRLIFSIDALPEIIRYFKIPQRYYSKKVTGMTFRKYQLFNPDLRTNKTNNTIELVWEINQPEGECIYRISW